MEKECDRTYAGVTKEQISRAKEWDLLSYLQTFEPQELRRSGPHEYCTISHDSLKISYGKWCWNSRRIGGRTALDYLIKVKGMCFVDAVELLSGTRGPVNHILPTQPGHTDMPRHLVLPEANRLASAVVPYLQRRGIHPEIISTCMEAGTLYESRRYQNCVFVGKDPSGQPRFACLRGTKGDFKQDVVGSDKRFSFFLPAAVPDCPRLAVAESPIDALSLATLVKRYGGNWKDSTYLSLSGTDKRAMLQFLRDHPAVDQVSLCLDNDSAGLTGIGRLEQAIREDAELSSRIKLVYRNPPPPEYGKDYNEFLCAIQALRHPVERVASRDI